MQVRGKLSTGRKTDEWIQSDKKEFYQKIQEVRSSSCPFYFPRRSWFLWSFNSHPLHPTCPPPRQAEWLLSGQRVTPQRPLSHQFSLHSAGNVINVKCSSDPVCLLFTTLQRLSIFLRIKIKLLPGSHEALGALGSMTVPSSSKLQRHQALLSPPNSLLPSFLRP